MRPFVRTRPNIYYAAAFKAPVDEGVSDTWEVDLKGYAKLNSEDSPYCVPNEYVAARLGQIVGLPIPPGGVIEGRSPSGGPAWVGLNFSPKGDRLPPIDPPTVYDALPELCAGVVVFDMLIANGDRHRKNLAYLPSKKRLEVFDHSHALLGTKEGAAIEHLSDVKDRFAIGNDASHNRQCLLDVLADVADINSWIDHVSGLINPRTLEQIGVEIVDLKTGVTDEEAEVLCTFLLDRCDHLRELIYEKRLEFARIDDAAWGLGI